MLKTFSRKFLDSSEVSKPIYVWDIVCREGGGERIVTYSRVLRVRGIDKLFWAESKQKSASKFDSETEQLDTVKWHG